jgi:2'-5' RNA ligase
MPDVYRAFIALRLPPQVRAHLAEVQACLADRGVRARWVRPESMHLTLKFLGPLLPEKVAAVAAALDPVAAACPPLALTTAGLGGFPSQRKARVLWVGVGGERTRLVELQQAIDTALAPLAWPAEKRPFKGHLTLARAKGRGFFADDIAVRLAQCEPGAAVAFEADCLTLYRSHLDPRGAVYEALRQWRL